MAQVFKKDFIERYVLHGKKHKDHAATVKQMNRIKMHADGITPKELLEERRPHESEEVKKYREKIFEPVTKDIPSRIITSVSKIRRSQDYIIKYDPAAVPKTILDEDTLQSYCEKTFPEFESVTNWFFSVCLRQYLIDPNGVVAVMPKSFDIKEEDYVKPFPYVFNSDQVLDFVSGQYAVLLSSDKSTYQDGENTVISGNIYYVITTTEVQKWEQINNNRELKQTLFYKHNLGELPVFKLGGVIVKNNDNSFIYESRIDGIVPRLNEASREYSDLQAEVVQHIFSEKFTFSNQDCTECKGNGSLIKGTASVQCTACGGSGKKSPGPYGKNIVRPGMAGEQDIPWPPSVYIQKDTNIVTIQDARIDKHLYLALASVNMQFLWQTPIKVTESGLAKEVDRDELNTLVYSIAEDSVKIIDRVYYFNNEYRYRIIVKDKEKRQAMLPKIPVPEKYDLLSSSFYVEEMSKAKTANVNPVIIQAMEIEYAGKKFNADPEIKKRLELIFSLDPLPGLTDDQKQARLTNKGISQEDYVISSNIQPFIRKAIQEDAKFPTLDTEKQMEVLIKFAQDKMKAMSAKEAVMKQIEQQQPNNSSSPTTAAAS